MQKKSSYRWRDTAMIFAACMLIVALFLSISVSAPALAQGQGEPTPTPNDPIWRAFNAARDAIEEERSVDLYLVRQYTFEQEENQHGIDWECDEDIPAVDVRPVYFGWTFRITDLGATTHQARVSFDLSAVAVCDKVTESSSPAPNPASAANNPDLPAPVAGSGATGSFELGGHALGLSQAAVDAMRQSGMTWVKYQLRWSLGDGTGDAQNMINDAHGKGFKLLLGIVGYPNQMGNFDSYIAAYSDYVARVAALGVDAIEVWNEPNIDREWPTGQVSGANYTRLLASAYNAIKTANRNVMVVSGAPSPTGYAGSAGCIDILCNDDVFMRQMADAGAASYMDCLGLHYNEGIVSPGTNAGDPRGEYPTYYFSSMLQRGHGLFSSVPVCWTELGYLSGESMGSPIPSFFSWASNVTLSQHASWLADAASRSAQTGYVRLMIIWNVNFSLWDPDPMGGYAIIRPDGTCPACSQLGAVMGK